jgi:exodeoxyribonuclease VII small subunit
VEEKALDEHNVRDLRVTPVVAEKRTHRPHCNPIQISYNGASYPMARKSNEFEKAFQHLETIVKRLESEEMPLDESLQLFEEGIRLSRFCNQKLEEVEKKIELILADAKGQPRIEPFESEELDEPSEVRSEVRSEVDDE